MNKKTLDDLYKEVPFNTIKLAAINTLQLAPKFLSEQSRKFKESKLDKDWNTFFAWLDTMLPTDQEFELHENKHLIFKGAIEVDRLATQTTDISNANTDSNE